MGCRGVRLVRVFPLAEPCSCSAGVFVEDDRSLGFDFSLAFQADLVSCRSLVYHMYSWFVELLVVASYMLCIVGPLTRDLAYDVFFLICIAGPLTRERFTQTR